MKNFLCGFNKDETKNSIVERDNHGNQNKDAAIIERDGLQTITSSNVETITHSETLDKWMRTLLQLI